MDQALQARIRERIKNSIAMVIALVVLIISIYPALWMHITSLRSNLDLFKKPWGLPSELHWENYATAFAQSPIPMYFKNSVIVSVASVALILFVASLAAYPLARLEFRFREPIFYLMISGLMIPPHVVLIPLLLALKKLGIYGTHLALIIPNTAFGLPFAIMMFRSYFLALPQELVDAARIDGCSRAGVYWRLILPLSKPVVAVVGIFSFVSTWNEFLFALTFIQDRALKTLPIGLMDFVGEVTTNWVLISAGLVIATFPTLVVYILFQKQILKSMLGGALKG